MTTQEYTILFVDDEPWLSEPLRLKLEARGFICVSKSDMSEAWNYLRSSKVTVVVTDIMMPAGDLFPDIDSSETGFHFVRKIRREFPDVSVICLSVIGDQNKISDLKSIGVLYLRKGETPLNTAAKLIESKATGIISY